MVGSRNLMFPQGPVRSLLMGARGVGVGVPRCVLKHHQDPCGTGPGRGCLTPGPSGVGVWAGLFAEPPPSWFPQLVHSLEQNLVCVFFIDLCFYL